MNYDPAPPGNRLLSWLPLDEMELLRLHLTPVTLVQGQRLYEPGQPIGHIFFIERGFAATMASMGVPGTGEAGGGAEAGLIGREGLVGLPVLLVDGARAFSSVVMQTPGSALTILAATLRNLWDDLPILRQVCLRAAVIQLAQLEQRVLCNARHSLRERLSRWLLMAHDRLDTKSMPLTQEILSTMLAVGRPSVNVAVKDLLSVGIVRGRRGHITVCDRPGLEALACGCYRRMEGYAASLPLPGRLSRPGPRSG